MNDTTTAERVDTLQQPLTAGQTTSLIVRDEDMRWMVQDQDAVFNALRNSVYPGADPAMVTAVMEYCRVNRLNPMLRPVHIVPMWIPEKKVEQNGRMVVLAGTGCMRDVIMPSIGHYRIQAHRTGRYIGLSRPQWGPMVEYQLGKDKVLVPESVAIAVSVMVDDRVVEFWHEERYLECYATAGRDKREPNAMWLKRPTGQMAKTAEAGALRKAFPELGDYTAEEMEGKTFDLVRGDDGVHRASDAAPMKQAATRSLDNFAGQGDGSPVKGNAKPKPAAKASGGSGSPAPAEKGATTPDAAKSDASGQSDTSGQDDLPTVDTGEVPKMPAAAAADWAQGKWSKAWRWINEVMPTLGPNDRQALAEQEMVLLHRVRNHNDAYAGAAEKFVTAMGVNVPEEGN